MLDRLNQKVDSIAPALRPALTFELRSTALFAVTLVPAAAWVLHQLVARSGSFAISDQDLLGFALSLPGLLFLLIGSGFTLAFWFAELAALFTFVERTSRGEEAIVSSILWHNVKLLPGLLVLALWQSGAFLVAALPWIGGIWLTHHSLLSEFDLYFYINVRPVEWWVALAIAATLTTVYLAVAGWLYLRWSLSVPIVVFEAQSPRDALRASWQRSVGLPRRIAPGLLARWLAVAFLAGLLTWGLRSLAGRLVHTSDALSILTVIVLAMVALIAVTDLLGLIAAKLVYAHALSRIYFRSAPAPAIDERFTDQTAVSRVASRGTLLLALVVTLAIGTALISGSNFFRGFSPRHELFVTGHRGNKSRTPENTLIAIEHAIEQGADYAEIDIQSTSDGELVLFHDADLMRIASMPLRLRDMTLEELRHVDAGSWFAPGFQGERIPTLEEAMDLARGRIRLNIELKYTWSDPHLAGRAARAIRDNDFESECVVSSLDVRGLTEFSQSLDAVPTGLIVFQAIGDVSRVDVDFLSLSAGRASARLVRDAHWRGRQVHVWTVNDLSTALSMIEIGVDNIITDEPRLIRDLMTDWEELSFAERLALMLRSLFLDLEPLSMAL
jgi:glycerophosphoryl diester phosphodiesterase